MKIAIVYASIHHKNTKKIVEAMAEAMPVDLINIKQNKNPDLTSYDIIGFASGVYYHGFDKDIMECIMKTEFSKNKKVFLVVTCGIGYKDYSKGPQKILKEKGIQFQGTFQCRGFDTFGIFGKIGGIAKNHPNQNDFEKAKQFITEIVK